MRNSIRVCFLVSAPLLLLSNSRKTGAGSSAPSEGRRSCFTVSRRVSAPFALAIAFQQSLPPADSSGCCTISGIVVDHATNRPLRGIAVLLNPSDRPGDPLRQITGEDGAFAFSHLSPEKYALMAQRRGEQPVGYQQYEGFFTGIVVGPNNATNIVFPLDSPARISGTVVDENGDPVPQANVILFRKSVSLGKAGTTQMGSANTGSSGLFHFSHLQAGTYFIGVSARPWYAENPPQFQPQQNGVGVPVNQVSNPELDVAYPVTYYADTTDPQAASPVVLNEGGGATIQVNLRAVPALHVPITGPATGEEPAEPNQGFNSSVSVEGPGGALVNIGAPVFGFGNSGELTGIAPGKYMVNINRFGNGKQQFGFSQSVDLAAGSTLQVRSGSSSSIAGRITFEGVAPRTPFIQFTGKTGNTGVQINPNGTFSLNESLAPGRYEILIPGAYVKLIAAKGATASGDSVEIPENGSVQLQITAGRGAGVSKIEGFVVRNGTGVPAAMVLLLPNDLDRPALIRRDQSDSDGSFNLPAILPGGYTLLAIDDGRDLAYQDPDVIKPYLAQGRPIEAPLNGNSKIEIPVIARRR
ncbi:MAG: carboxypeptidase regulatory-like domain-containing protein [Acidobacteriaceae bacterium]|nr:carboxypeptidase regulatory-like domain-containing protein [Acidobacteriaceae bacterium]MBV9497914.1 carboxypeptidase regulatory-like domain-containing protein [Acidobacteriaceae bacterium]